MNLGRCGLTVMPKLAQYVYEAMLWKLIAVLIVVVSAEAIPPRCFENLGCFSMNTSWYNPRRPVPGPTSPQVMQVKAYYFSRDHVRRRYIMSTWPKIDMQSAPFDKNKFTFFITHGFQNTGTDPWIFRMKDALLNRTDANIIVGDWGGGAKVLSYFQGVANLRMAARQFSNLLQFMIDQRGLNVTRLNIIGHSLGAQIAGQIGKSIPGVFQITALDPAQPLFEGFDEPVRLTKHDAAFVIAVHADARPFVPDVGFGVMNMVGDNDYYINGGHGQPGCRYPKVVNIPKIRSILDFAKVPMSIFVQTLLCPHGLSLDFWTEAIMNRDCIFWGHLVTMENMIRGISNAETAGFFSKFLAADNECTVEDCSPMNLDAYYWPARGPFVVMTRGSAPYCIYDAGTINATAQRDFVVTLQNAAINLLDLDEESRAYYGNKQKKIKKDASTTN